MEAHFYRKPLLPCIYHELIDHPNIRSKTFIFIFSVNFSLGQFSQMVTIQGKERNGLVQLRVLD